MSKEYIEAFNEIIDKFAEQIMRANKEELTAINKTNAIEYLYRTPQVRLLNETLQRLEAIDNIKPSEALEFLKQQAIAFERSELAIKVANENYDSIKQALLKAQEQEKVLKVIFEKNVDIIRIRHLIFKSQKNPKYWDLRYYNEARVIDDEKLTQEEFNLLKRYCDEQD